MRVSAYEFQALDLEVHAFLEGVPLHDVWAIDLPGGRPDRSLSDLLPFLSLERLASASLPVRALFSLRLKLGRLFGWDREAHRHPEESYLQRLTSDQRERSLVPPGSMEGPFRLLYVFSRELLAEIRNATAHAFVCLALGPGTSAQRLYFAVFVKPVSRFTPLYLAAIEPFRRFIVYPAILRRLRAAWAEGRPAAP